MSDREHLFRDEAGSALERAARLQDENAQLRAQLVHERSARQAQTVRTPRKSSSAAMIVVATCMVLGLSLMVAAAALVLTRRAASAPVVVVTPAATVAEGDAPFDRAAAAAALGSVDVAPCKKPGGPSGSGHVKVTFAPTGKVLSTAVDAPPYEGTDVGACVAARYELVQIPPFSGSSVAVGKAFTLE